MCESCDSAVWSDEQIAQQMVKAREAVQKGVTLLNDFGPTDWRSQIRKETLNLGSAQDCVLAQALRQEVGYSDFWDAKDLLIERVGSDFDSSDYGFNDKMYVWNPETEREETEFSYVALTRAWLEELSKEDVPA